MKQELVLKDKLPDGWKWSTLGEECEVITGGTPSRSFKEYYGGKTPWIKPSDLDKETYVDSSDEYLTELGCKESRMLPLGSVLVSCIGNLGKIAIAKCELATNQQINSLIPSKSVDSKYLYYYIKFIQPLLVKTASTALVPILNKSLFSGLPIILPPLPVQKQIVAKLDAQMAQIEIMKKEAEKEKGASEEMKRSLLAKMFESISNKCISKPISEICYKPQYGYTASSTIEKVGPKMLRITDIQDGEVIWECVPYCLCSDEDYKKYELKDNDLVFVRIGATTGKSFLIKNPKNSIFASYLIRLNISDKNVLPDYLYLFFQSQKYWQVILKDSRGGIMPNFNAEMLSKLEIPIPNKEIQEELIKKTNILDESINIIQQNITQKLSAISLLSSSLLNEVFGKYEIPEVK